MSFPKDMLKQNLECVHMKRQDKTPLDRFENKALLNVDTAISRIGAIWMFTDLFCDQKLFCEREQKVQNFRAIYHLILQKVFLCKMASFRSISLKKNYLVRKLKKTYFSSCYSPANTYLLLYQSLKKAFSACNGYVIMILGEAAG